MEKEQEKLRDEFVSETGGQLDAVNEGANVDIGFSDAYVHWLENRLLISNVGNSLQEIITLKEYYSKIASSYSGGCYSQKQSNAIEKVKELEKKIELYEK